MADDNPPSVSPGNPCPFLRALVAAGLLEDRRATIGDAADVIEAVASRGDGEPHLPGFGLRLVALLANGLSPAAVLHNGLHGVRLDALRNGPFDKQGTGSRILDAQARVDHAELARLQAFARPKRMRGGGMEAGLDAGELEAMMDANFERAAGHRRAVDRQIMKAEWLPLLQVMGKQGEDARYLSLEEVRALFAECRLPARLTMRPGRAG